MDKFSQFTYRHIGSSIEDQNSMLHEINCNSLDDLLNSCLKYIEYDNIMMNIIDIK